MDFTFEQNQTVEALDKVPAPFNAFYVEADGKFSIDPKFKDVTKSIDGLNKTAKTLRGGEKTLKDQVAAWSGLGESPEAVKTMLEDLNEKLAKGEKINPEKIKQDLNAGFDKERNTWKEEKSGLENAVRKYLITSAATSALAEAKGSVELLLPIVERQVKMVKADNGDYKVVVVDAQGDTRFGAGGSELTIAELVANLKADKSYARAFDSESAGGGGTDPKKTSQPARQPVKEQGDKSPMDKIAAGLKARKIG